MQVFKDDKEFRAYAKNMTVVILFIKIRDNDEFFILLNTICDAKNSFSGEKFRKKYRSNFLCLRQVGLFPRLNNPKTPKGCL